MVYLLSLTWLCYIFDLLALLFSHEAKDCKYNETGKERRPRVDQGKYDGISEMEEDTYGGYCCIKQEYFSKVK